MYLSDRIFRTVKSEEEFSAILGEICMAIKQLNMIENVPTDLTY